MAKNKIQTFVVDKTLGISFDASQITEKDGSKYYLVEGLGNKKITVPDSVNLEAIEIKESVTSALANGNNKSFLNSIASSAYGYDIDIEKVYTNEVVKDDETMITKWNQINTSLNKINDEIKTIYGGASESAGAIEYREKALCAVISKHNIGYDVATYVEMNKNGKSFEDAKASVEKNLNDSKALRLEIQCDNLEKRIKAYEDATKSSVSKSPKKNIAIGSFVTTVGLRVAISSFLTGGGLAVPIIAVGLGVLGIISGLWKTFDKREYKNHAKELRNELKVLSKELEKATALEKQELRTEQDTENKTENENKAEKELEDKEKILLKDEKEEPKAEKEEENPEETKEESKDENNEDLKEEDFEDLKDDKDKSDKDEEESDEDKKEDSNDKEKEDDKDEDDKEDEEESDEESDEEESEKDGDNEEENPEDEDISEKDEKDNPEEKSEKSDELKEKEEALDKREEALNDREKELEAREKAVSDKEKELGIEQKNDNPEKSMQQEVRDKKAVQKIELMSYKLEKATNGTAELEPDSIKPNGFEINVKDDILADEPKVIEFSSKNDNAQIDTIGTDGVSFSFNKNIMLNSNDLFNSSKSVEDNLGQMILGKDTEARPLALEKITYLKDGVENSITPDELGDLPKEEYENIKDAMIDVMGEDATEKILDSYEKPEDKIENSEDNMEDFAEFDSDGDGISDILDTEIANADTMDNTSMDSLDNNDNQDNGFNDNYDDYGDNEE